MLEIISIIICFFTKKQLNKDQGVDLKRLELINSITLICLVFFRVVGIVLGFGVRPNLLVTAILIWVYIHNIKILHIRKKSMTSIYCNNCGMSIKSSDLFCQECGHKNEFYAEV